MSERVNDVLIQRLKDAEWDPQAIDLSLSVGFMSVMVWSDFLRMTKDERDFVFWLADMMRRHAHGYSVATAEEEPLPLPPTHAAKPSTALWLAPKPEEEHVHRWILSAPDGPVVHQRCDCGESKDVPADPQSGVSWRGGDKRPNCPDCGKRPMGDKHGLWCNQCQKAVSA